MSILATSKCEETLSRPIKLQRYYVSHLASEQLGIHQVVLLDVTRKDVILSFSFEYSLALRWQQLFW